LVRDHFVVVFSAVGRYGGAAVKTIGDGVMATFFDNDSALKGAVESIRGIQKLNEQANLSGGDRLRLKIGLHAGACIVVTLNHRHDYFGSTINIAARLSDMAEGDDLYFSEPVINNSKAYDLARSLGNIEEINTTLRGMMHPVNVCRLTPH
jgi:class 3 adenylate cyclase